ncbi:MAG: B12-binding domain-containing protein [Phycisphaerae bacterium]|nr:B12-binding domain-containing protein [Phycisphaerae bacterium]
MVHVDIIIQIVQHRGFAVELLTPNQVARSIGVSEASIKRWCDKGTVASIRTAGGHRRLPLNEVMRFIRQTGQPIVRPEVLGLPPRTGRGKETLKRAQAQMRPALEAGDEQRIARIAFDLYLAGHMICDICDQVLAPAFHGIGSRWQHGEIEVYEERRACEACMRVLYQMRNVLPSVPDSAPRAIGATLEGDPYTLPTLMAETVLREAGWRADSFGTGHPFSTLCAAIGDVRPRLFWLSVSTIGSVPDFLAGYAMFYETAVQCDVRVVVGGRALTEAIRRRIEYAAYGDTLRHLISFARSAHSSA